MGELTVNSDDSSFTTTLENLNPGTTYTITVAAVNGAGLGMMSTSVVGVTDTGIM